MTSPALQISGFLSAVGVLSFLFAMVEIQIEGSGGWASNLPTWRIEKHWLLDVFFGGRPLTGYHAWVFSFMALLFHLPLLLVWALGAAVSYGRLELTILAAIMLFWILEDLLWFVLNPGFGLRAFRKERVTWHKRWLLGAPVDYWVFGVLALVLLYQTFLAHGVVPAGIDPRDLQAVIPAVGAGQAAP